MYDIYSTYIKDLFLFRLNNLVISSCNNLLNELTGRAIFHSKSCHIEGRDVT